MNSSIRGDFATLDLVGIFQALGRPAMDAGPGKYWVRCPWSDEHSVTGRKDTVIWQEPGKWPQFHCSHSHCNGRALLDVLAWAESLRPGIVADSCSGEYKRSIGFVGKQEHRELPKIARGAEALVNADRFLKGFKIDEADLWHASPIYPGEDWRADSVLFMAHLYAAIEFVCICTDFDLQTKKDGSQKAVPKGSGETRTVGEWLLEIDRNGPPIGSAGSWVRFNPVTETGSGQSGAHRDQDVTAFRYLLVESDELPIAVQLSLYARLVMPVAALLTSGGKSVHAVVRIDAESEGDFKIVAADVLRRLMPFGVDPSNRNPSRYGRLPGVLRSIGATGSGRQRLLYLNPEPKGGSIFS